MKLSIGMIMAALLTSTANAETVAINDNFKLDINGQFSNTIVASTSDMGETKVLNNAILDFRPTVTLDNGITFIGSATLNQKGFMPPQLMVRGGFGEFHIGSSHSAGKKLAVSAPNYATGSALSFMNIDADTMRGALASTAIENRGNYTNKRLTYYSPRIEGVKLGLSYAEHSQIGPAIDIGLNYKLSNGDYTLTASTRYGIMTDTNTEVFGAGLKAEYNNFEIGASFAKQIGAAYQDGQSYDIGVGYTHNKWKYSATYFNGVNVDNTHLTSNEALEMVTLAVDYSLSNNLSMNAFVSNGKFEDGVASGNKSDTIVGFTTTFKF